MRSCPPDVVACECGLSFHMMPTGVTYHRVALHSIHLALPHVVECECGLLFHVLPTGVMYHGVALHSIHPALPYIVIKLC